MSNHWLELAPEFIKKRLKNRPKLLIVLSNIAWLYADRILRMGVGLLVTVWIARYLGPDQLGLFSYAMAYVALFGSIAGLGLNDIVVRDLVHQHNGAQKTLGSAFTLQILGGLIAIGLIVTSINLVRPDDPYARLIVCVLSVSMVFKASEVVKYWFESQVLSKYSVWIENSVFCILSLVRIGLIYTGAPLIAFVWTTVLESMLVAIGLLVIYTRKGGSVNSWRPNFRRSKKLLNDSWPLILTGLAIIIYMRIDQIMISHMLGDATVGIYSAAVRISEVWYFMPMAIVASVFPSILESKRQGEELYYRQLQRLYDLMALISVIIAILLSFTAGTLVTTLFGKEYIEAGPILEIYAWAGIFVALGVARGKWLVTENLQHMGYLYVGIAMLVNIGGNLILIPLYGAIGASLATVLAQLTTAIIAPALFASTRISTVMLLRALNPVRWFHTIEKFVVGKKA